MRFDFRPTIAWRFAVGYTGLLQAQLANQLILQISEWSAQHPGISGALLLGRLLNTCVILSSDVKRCSIPSILN